MVGERGRRYLRARRQRHAEGAPLVQQRRHRHRPSFSGVAEDLRLRHLDVLEEDLVELRVAGDLHQRPYLDARALQSVKKELLMNPPPRPAVLLRPGNADVAGVVELLLPYTPAIDESLLALRHRTVVPRFVRL